MNVVYPRNQSITEAEVGGERSPSAALLDRLETTIAAVDEHFASMNIPQKPSPAPEELARRSQAGCMESFEQLVLLFENQIFNFLRHLTSNAQDAEDLTQETFVKAYRNLDRYRPSLAFVPWLFVIARRTAASHFRSLKHFEELPLDSESHEANPATALEHKDEQKSLWHLVRTLKSKQAEAVWLRYAEGFSVAETARIMHTNQVYVKVLLHRARSNLSKILAARGIDLSQSAAPGLALRPNAPNSKSVL